MRNYYVILGVHVGASTQEIKKGYFSMIRKYPSDKFPQAFMEIREAYEFLSNERTKKEYNKIMSFKKEAAERFDAARTFIKEGSYSKAIPLLDHLTKEIPDILMIQSLLGETYRNNENSGKAVKIFEMLTSIDEKNASFQGHLANAYLERSFTLKAIDAYEKAIALDEDNISLWQGLFNAHSYRDNASDSRGAILRAIAVGNKNDWEDISIFYFNLILLDIRVSNKLGMKVDLDNLLKLAVDKPELKDNIAWSIVELSKNMMNSEMTEEANLLVETSLKLLPGNKEINKLAKGAKTLSTHHKEFSVLELDKDIHADVTSLIELYVFPEEVLEMDARHKEAFSYFNELHIIQDFDMYMQSIETLLSRYAALYELKKEFFNEVMDATKRKSMLKRYLSNLSKYKWFEKESREYMMEESFDDDLADEAEKPFVREDSKVGRNDPCPCGSGKKYKKCCENK